MVLSQVRVIESGLFEAVYQEARVPDLRHRDYGSQLADLLDTNVGIIGGGAARAAIMDGEGPEAHDIDIFMRHGYLLSAARAKLSGLGYVQALSQPNGVTTWKRDDGELPVQLIPGDTNHALLPGESWTDGLSLIKTFGLKYEQFALELEPNTREYVATYSVDGEADVLNKRISINRIVDPLRLVYRMVKAGRKGYEVKPSEVARLFEVYAAASDARRTTWQIANSEDTYQFDIGPRV